MSNELYIILKRVEEIKGKNFTIKDVYILIEDMYNVDLPYYIKDRFINLKQELTDLKHEAHKYFKNNR